MDAASVKTIKEFVQFVDEISKTTAEDYKGDLGEFFRSLWSLIQKNKDALVTWALLAQLIQDAFSQESPPFNPEWLVYTDPPSLNTTQAKENGFEALKALILYQIADWQRMDEAGMLKDPFRGLGIYSPTRHKWYNFDPSIFLRCAVAVGTTSETTEADWYDLAVLLWMGQIYE